MKSIMNILRGCVEIKIMCRWPERFMNISAQNGVEFFGLKRTGECELCASVYIKDYRRLRLLSEKGGFTVEAVKKKGLPFLAWRLRRRWVLPLSLAVCIVSVWVSSIFILEMEVEGNETVPSGEILQALSDIGVGIGTIRFTLDSDYISNEMLIKVPKLSWIAVNCTGSRAHVLVREERETPEIYDKNRPANIVALKSGIIKEINVIEGTRICAPGDTVEKGDILVSGAMDSLSSGVRHVGASAEVWARTWYDISSSIPIVAERKEYTGKSSTRYAAVFAGKRINLSFSGRNSYKYCDKIITSKKLTLFGGAVLPVTFLKEVCSEYYTVPADIDIAFAEKMLREQLRSDLLKKIGETGRVVSLEYESDISDNVLTVMLSAECTERIDKTEEYFSQEEP